MVMVSNYWVCAQAKLFITSCGNYVWVRNLCMQHQSNKIHHLNYCICSV